MDSEDQGRVEFGRTEKSHIDTQRRFALEAQHSRDRQGKVPPGRQTEENVVPGAGGDSGRLGHVVGAATGQNLGLSAQPSLFGVAGLASTLFVEFVGALADFFPESFRVPGFHRHLPYEQLGSGRVACSTAWSCCRPCRVSAAATSSSRITIRGDLGSVNFR